MSLRDRAAEFAVKKTFAKELDEHIKDESADIKSELLDLYEESGADRVAWQVGSMKGSVTLCAGRETIVGDGPEFMEFMREHGMTIETVDPGWKDCVAKVGGRVVWAETGEPVPGASIQTGAEYLKVNGVKASERMKLIEEAGRIGIIGGAAPMLGEGE